MTTVLDDFAILIQPVVYGDLLKTIIYRYKLAAKWSENDAWQKIHYSICINRISPTFSFTLCRNKDSFKSENIT